MGTKLANVGELPRASPLRGSLEGARSGGEEKTKKENKKREKTVLFGAHPRAIVFDLRNPMKSQSHNLH